MPPPRAGRRRASSARPLRYASAYFFALIKFTQRKTVGSDAHELIEAIRGKGRSDAVASRARRCGRCDGGNRRGRTGLRPAAARSAHRGARAHRLPPSPHRRATSARTARPTPTSPIPTSSPSIRRSTRCASPTRRSSGCGPARCGRRGRRGTRRAATWCGATSPTTASCAGSRTTAASACSACRRTTATATPSTSRAASSPAST